MFVLVSHRRVPLGSWSADAWALGGVPSRYIAIGTRCNTSSTEDFVLPQLTRRSEHFPRTRAHREHMAIHDSTGDVPSSDVQPGDVLPVDEPSTSAVDAGTRRPAVSFNSFPSATTALPTSAAGAPSTPPTSSPRATTAPLLPRASRRTSGRPQRRGRVDRPPPRPRRARRSRCLRSARRRLTAGPPPPYMPSLTGAPTAPAAFGVTPIVCQRWSAGARATVPVPRASPATASAAAGADRAPPCSPSASAAIALVAGAGGGYLAGGHDDDGRQPAPRAAASSAAFAGQSLSVADVVQALTGSVVSGRLGDHPAARPFHRSRARRPAPASSTTATATSSPTPTSSTAPRR